MRSDTRSRGDQAGGSDLSTSAVLVIAIACLLFLFSLFAVSTIFFLFKVPVTPANTIISVLLTLGFVARESSKKVLTTVVTLGVIAASVAIISYFYDASWDGNVYHKLSAGLIKDGWNPVYQQFSAYANDSGRFIQHEWNGFYDGYPKASYIISACLYAATGTIESGKAFTLLSMVAATGIIAVLLKEIGEIRLWQSILVSLPVCFNAATLGAVITSYNDGFLAMLIFISVAAFTYLANTKSGQYNRYAYVAIFTSVVLGVNLKFSALFPFTIICLVYYGLLIFSQKGRNSWLFRTTGSPNTNFAFLAVTAVCATLVFGATSYARNIAFYRNPLYPMIGANKEDVLAVAIPPAFKNLSPIQQFTGSLFSSISHDPKLSSIPLKIPFAFNSEEARNSLYWGARTGGWGIWFSGILLVSLVAYAWIARRAGKSLNVAFVAISIICIAPTFFIPGLNVARYWPLPVLIPPFVLFLYFAIGRARRWGTFLAVTALAINIALPVGGVLLATRQSWRVHNDMDRLSAYDQKGRPLAISLGPPYLAERENLSVEAPRSQRLHGTEAFNGILFNLDDAGIVNFVQIRPGDVEKVAGDRRLIAFSVGKDTPVGFVYILTND